MSDSSSESEVEINVSKPSKTAVPKKTAKALEALAAKRNAAKVEKIKKAKAPKLEPVEEEEEEAPPAPKPAPKPPKPEVAVNQSIDVEKIKADLKAELKREAEEAKKAKKPKKKVVIEESESEDEEEEIVIRKPSRKLPSRSVPVVREPDPKPLTGSALLDQLFFRR
jgi:hypothetical protein